MKKKRLISAAVVALLGGAVFGAGYAVQPLASYMIRQNGFPEAKVSGFFLTPTGLMIDHIALDGNDFSTVDQVNITVHWWDFLTGGKIDTVSVKHISLTCEWDDQGQFKIAGWDATLPKSSTSDALIPLKNLLLQGVTLDMETEQGNIRIQGKLAVSTPDPAHQVLQYTVWGQQHQISFEAKGDGRLGASGDMSLVTTVNDGRINLPDIEISRAAGTVTYQRSATAAVPVLSGQIVAGKVNTLGALLQNVAINVDTTKPVALSFQSSPAGHKDISVQGQWVSAPDNHLEMKVTSASAMELVDIVAADKAEDVKPWLGQANPLTLMVTAPVSALQDAKKVAKYTLQAGGTSSRMTLASTGTLEYDSGTEVSTLHSQDTQITLAKGRVEVSPFAWASNYQGDPPLSVSLTLRNMDMAELAQLADIDGLTATGTLNGTLPLTYTKDGLVLGKGNVTSAGEGRFSYTPTTFPPSLQGDDMRMDTLRKTLSNFHFTQVSMDMSGPFSGKMTTRLTAEGKSPAFGDRPVKLNLNLDGDLGRVITQTLQAGDVGDKIRSHMGAQGK